MFLVAHDLHLPLGAFMGRNGFRKALTEHKRGVPCRRRKGGEEVHYQQDGSDERKSRSRATLWIIHSCTTAFSKRDTFYDPWLHSSTRRRSS